MSGNGLFRWERATRTLHDMARTAGLPSLKDHLPATFQEDRAGNLWVGFAQGELARYAVDRFEVFTSAIDVTAFITISFGSVRAGAAGVELHAARTMASVATRASGSNARRRVTKSPWGAWMNGRQRARGSRSVSTAEGPDLVRGDHPEPRRQRGSPDADRVPGTHCVRRARARLARRTRGP